MQDLLDGFLFILIRYGSDISLNMLNQIHKIQEINSCLDYKQYNSEKTRLQYYNVKGFCSLSGKGLKLVIGFCSITFLFLIIVIETNNILNSNHQWGKEEAFVFNLFLWRKNFDECLNNILALRYWRKLRIKHFK
jgi:hypothetical protein